MAVRQQFNTHTSVTDEAAGTVKHRLPAHAELLACPVRLLATQVKVQKGFARGDAFEQGRALGFVPTDLLGVVRRFWRTAASAIAISGTVSSAGPSVAPAENRLRVLDYSLRSMPFWQRTLVRKILEKGSLLTPLYLR